MRNGFQSKFIPVFGRPPFFLGHLLGGLHFGDSDVDRVGDPGAVEEVFAGVRQGVVVGRIFWPGIDVKAVLARLGWPAADGQLVIQYRICDVLLQEVIIYAVHSQLTQEMKGAGDLEADLRLVVKRDHPCHMGEGPDSEVPNSLTGAPFARCTVRQRVHLTGQLLANHLQGRKFSGFDILE